MSNELDRRFLLGGLAGAAGISALAAVSKGGPLIPPVGALASTGKPIGEIEPRTAVNTANTPGSSGYLYTITQPGSYYLTGNVTRTGTQQGVLIATPGVTLDLNGFTVSGQTGAYGIASNDPCTIRNGAVAGFQYSVNPSSGDSTLEDLTLSGAITRSIFMGQRSTARRCEFRGSTPVHLECTGDYALVEHCLFNAPGAQGLYLNSYSTVRDSRFIACATGAQIGYASRAERCTFDACASRGIQGGTRSSIEACTVVNTGANGIGIELPDGCTVTHCRLGANPTGIRAAGACRIADCYLDAHTAAAIKLTSSGAVVESCTFMRNAIALDMTAVSGNYLHKSVMLGNTNPIAVSVGGNWYPNVTLGSVNAATNPLFTVIG